MAVHHELPPTPWGRGLGRLGDTVIAFWGWVRRLGLGILLGLATAAAIIAVINADSRAPGFILGGGLILLGVGLPLWRLTDPPPDVKGTPVTSFEDDQREQEYKESRPNAGGCPIVLGKAIAVIALVWTLFHFRLHGGSREQ